MSNLEVLVNAKNTSTYLANKQEIVPVNDEAILLNVVDGDTFDVLVNDANINMVRELRIRLSGINCPEMVRAAKPKPEKQQQQLAAEHAKTQLTKLLNKYKSMTIKLGSLDNYGRHIADVKVNKGKIDVSQFMIDNKYAQVYTGGSLKKVVYDLSQFNFN